MSADRLTGQWPLIEEAAVAGIIIVGYSFVLLRWRLKGRPDGGLSHFVEKLGAFYAGMVFVGLVGFELYPGFVAIVGAVVITVAVVMVERKTKGPTPGASDPEDDKGIKS